MEKFMAQVTATIAGRQFRLACEDGQEDHLQALAADIDERITELRRKFGEIGDTRLTVMAALTVADELKETTRRLRRLEEEVEDARVVAADRAKAASAAVVNAFNSAAERIEGITKKLNTTVGNGGGVAMG
jgi:cell division protein ZapA